MRLRIFFLLVPIIFLSCGVSSAQEPVEPSPFPEADIFLFNISFDGTKMLLTNGRNATNRPGYDNQPFFTRDSKTFLYSRSEGSQTDVFEYLVDSQKSNRITQSANMEFSPTPSLDQKSVAYVTDGEGANQSIWKVSRTDLENPSWMLKDQPEREPVGYFAWNQKTGYILFWSRYGFNVRLVHESKKLSHYVAGNAVPSSPQIIPGTNNFSFLHRQGNGEVWIKELNPETKAIRPLTSIVGTNSHYGWTPDGWVVMIDDTTLYRWRDGEKEWNKVCDLASVGLKNGSRVAISPDGKLLAVVGVPIGTIKTK